MYKLHEQCAVKIVPKFGGIKIDVLQPHHYDVVPSLNDPERAEVYIISSFDRSRIIYSDNFPNNGDRFSPTQLPDGVNQKIGDPDDWKQSNKVYYWWTAEYNFKTNKLGQVLDDNNNPLTQANFNNYANPIGCLPFVDIATEKDYEFWVRAGDSITEFNIDFGAQLSDNVNINAMQGFSQAVISSVEEPKNIIVGPKRVLWLKINPKEEAATRPEFSFVSPSPDIKGSIELSEGLLKYFLVSKSINIKDMLQGTATASSGLERLLMMIEKFEASQDDIDLFKSVEHKAYEIMVKWHNAYRGTKDGLSPKLDGPEVNENSEVQVKFGKPEMIQSKLEKISTIEKEIDLGIMTPIEAIMQLREVDQNKAEEIYESVKKFNGLTITDENTDVNTDDDVQGDEEE